MRGHNPEKCGLGPNLCERCKKWVEIRTSKTPKKKSISDSTRKLRGHNPEKCKNPKPCVRCDIWNLKRSSNNSDKKNRQNRNKTICKPFAIYNGNIKAHTSVNRGTYPPYLHHRRYNDSPGFISSYKGESPYISEESLSTLNINAPVLSDRIKEAWDTLASSIDRLDVDVYIPTNNTTKYNFRRNSLLEGLSEKELKVRNNNMVGAKYQIKKTLLALLKELNCAGDHDLFTHIVAVPFVDNDFFNDNQETNPIKYPVVFRGAKNFTKPTIRFPFLIAFIRKNSDIPINPEGIPEEKAISLVSFTGYIQADNSKRVYAQCSILGGLHGSLRTSSYFKIFKGFNFDKYGNGESVSTEDIEGVGKITESSNLPNRYYYNSITPFNSQARVKLDLPLSGTLLYEGSAGSKKVSEVYGNGHNTYTVFNPINNQPYEDWVKSVFNIPVLDRLYELSIKGSEISSDFSVITTATKEFFAGIGFAIICKGKIYKSNFRFL